MHLVLMRLMNVLINKDIKTTIVSPSKEYLDRLMYYYPIRAKLCKQGIENTLNIS